MHARTLIEQGRHEEALGEYKLSLGLEPAQEAREGATVALTALNRAGEIASL